MTLCEELNKQCQEAYTADEAAAIKRAADFATKAHEGQFRQTGDPYITHPLSVAKILVTVCMDADCVIAGLLHDVVEDCGVELKEIRDMFGDDVAVLVDGVTKLSHSPTPTKQISDEERNAENYRKLFVAIARDPRVVVIKLADRLHNMRTLSGCPKDKQLRIAQDTMKYFAPIAHRFGIGTIKCELEDLAFKYIDPDEYSSLKAEVDKKQAQRTDLLKEATQRIDKRLNDENIPHEINGRPKHLYSIYRKMKAQDVTLEGVYDLIALRVIVDTVAECYQVLGIIHSMWKPMPGRMKDYISVPKPNMYQSLHTTLFSDIGIPFEVQIRTREMHKAAEYGVASHWSYKEKTSGSQQSYFDKIMSWLRDMMSYQDITTTAKEFVSDVQHDFFTDYVFVVTPHGEVVDLPMGSTPLDFAYRIHTDIGNRAVRAKVNGVIVKFDYVLKNNDVVAIETGPTESPARDWLRIVKTQQAKAKIKQWFKKADRADNINSGKAMLTEALQKYDKNLSDFDEKRINATLEKFGMSKTEELFLALGRGSVAVSSVMKKLLEAEIREEEIADLNARIEAIKAENAAQTESEAQRVGDASSEGVIVPGFPTVAVHIARCCHPLTGDPIIGYITKGRGVSVHRADCPNARALQKDESRKIPVRWTLNSGKHVVYVNVVADERKGLLADVSQALYSINIDIKYINAATDRTGRIALVRLAFEIEDLYRLGSVIAQLKTVESVSDVYRV